MLLIEGRHGCMAAKLMPVDNLTPGMILADAALSLNGKVLLGKGVDLTPRHIALLITWDVQSVFVDSAEAEAEPVEISAERPAESLECLACLTEQNEIVQTVGVNFDIVRKFDIIPVAQIRNSVQLICSAIKPVHSFEVMNALLINQATLTDFIPRHSVMVAYFSGLIAHQLKWSEADIMGVVTASLLHDIGNLSMRSIDDLRIKTDLAKTAALLKKTQGLSNQVILGIVQHRERSDGGGYPTGVQGDKIHPYARVIGVADFFHNVAYKDTCNNPFPVLDTITAGMFDKFDLKICMVFIGQIKNSLLNNRIMLSNGKEAQIVFFNSSAYSLPIVKTLDGEFVDLSKNTNIHIAKMISPF